ncbi:Bacillus/Clostridium GerA spore germination protein [Mycobacteroides abscessus subsp. abscessus]|nr:Bacillus/Clostridium GerA spore germination protein [Mycobacteroides abscessus subsp. abscessus]
MIGQVAVEVGLFINEVVLYLAIAAIGTFSTPSYEVTFLIFMLARINSFGVPYLWPFLPFNLRAFRDVLLRSPIPLKNRRPRFLHPKDPDR